MIYSHEVEKMCTVAKGPHHGPAPIPEEGRWVKSYEIKDISGLSHGIGWCAPQQGTCKLTLNVKDGIVEEALVELEDQLIDLQAMTGADYLRDKVKDKKGFLSGLDKNMLKKIGKAAEVAGSIIPGTGATVLGKATGALFKGLAKSK